MSLNHSVAHSVASGPRPNSSTTEGRMSRIKEAWRSRTWLIFSRWILSSPVELAQSKSRISILCVPVNVVESTAVVAALGHDESQGRSGPTSLGRWVLNFPPSSAESLFEINLLFERPLYNIICILQIHPWFGQAALILVFIYLLLSLPQRRVYERTIPSASQLMYLLELIFFSWRLTIVLNL